MTWTEKIKEKKKQKKREELDLTTQSAQWLMFKRIYLQNWSENFKQEWIYFDLETK